MLLLLLLFWLVITWHYYYCKALQMPSMIYTIDFTFHFSSMARSFSLYRLQPQAIWLPFHTYYIIYTRQHMPATGWYSIFNGLWLMPFLTDVTFTRCACFYVLGKSDISEKCFFRVIYFGGVFVERTRRIIGQYVVWVSKTLGPLFDTMLELAITALLSGYRRSNYNVSKYAWFHARFTIFFRKYREHFHIAEITTVTVRYLFSICFAGRPSSAQSQGGFIIISPIRGDVFTVKYSASPPGRLDIRRFAWLSW